MPSLITSFPIWSARCYTIARPFHSSRSHSVTDQLGSKQLHRGSVRVVPKLSRCSSAYFCATPERIPSVPSNSISDLFLAVLRSSISILCQSHLNRCLTTHTLLFRSGSSPVDSVPILCSAHHFGHTPHHRCPALRSAMSLLLTSPPCLRGATPGSAVSTRCLSFQCFAFPTLRLAVRPGPFHSVQSCSVSGLCARLCAHPSRSVSTLRHSSPFLTFAIRRGSGLSPSAAMQLLSFPCQCWAMILGSKPFRFRSVQLTDLLFRSSAAPIKTARGLAGANQCSSGPAMLLLG